MEIEQHRKDRAIGQNVIEMRFGVDGTCLHPLACVNTQKSKL